MRPKLSNLTGNDVTMQRLNAGHITRLRKTIAKDIRDDGEVYEDDETELEFLEKTDKDLIAEIKKQLFAR